MRKERKTEDIEKRQGEREREKESRYIEKDKKKE
jgi:hypothetical protein